MTDIAKYSSTHNLKDFIALVMNDMDEGEIGASMTTFLTLSEYNGFEPGAFYQMFYKKAVNTYSDTNIKDRMRKIINDVSKLIVFVVVRGTNMFRSDLNTRSSGGDSLVASLKEITNRYGIVKNIQNKDSITPQRICAIHPHLVARALLLYNKSKFSGDVAIEYQFPSAPSLFSPSELDNKEFMEKWYKWSYNFAKAINSNPTRPEVKDNKSQRGVPDNFEDYKKSQESIVKAIADNEFTQIKRDSWRSSVALYKASK